MEINVANQFLHEGSHKDSLTIEWCSGEQKEHLDYGVCTSFYVLLRVSLFYLSQQRKPTTVVRNQTPAPSQPQATKLDSQLE